MGYKGPEGKLLLSAIADLWPGFQSVRMMGSAASRNNLRGMWTPRTLRSPLRPALGYRRSGRPGAGGRRNRHRPSGFAALPGEWQHRSGCAKDSRGIHGSHGQRSVAHRLRNLPHAPLVPIHIVTRPGTDLQRPRAPGSANPHRSADTHLPELQPGRRIPHGCRCCLLRDLFSLPAGARGGRHRGIRPKRPSPPGGTASFPR